jgi:cyclin B
MKNITINYNPLKNKKLNNNNKKISTFLEKGKLMGTLYNKIHKINRKFGNDITNLNLTASDFPTNNNKSNFLKAFENLKSKQLKFERNKKNITSVIIKKIIPEIVKTSEKKILLQKNNFMNNINSNKENINSNKNCLINDDINNNNNNTNNIINNNNNNFIFETFDKHMEYEYLSEIYELYKSSEFNYMVNPNYMSINQSNINEKMRAILIDWLVDVHLKFNLLPETLFLTINIIDRYLEKKSINRNYLQLVGVTSLLIACKYEEIYPPETKALVYITDNAYNKKEVIDMESDILKTLNFEVTIVSIVKYIEYIKIKMNYNNFQFNQIMYFAELSIINYNMLKYSPFIIAISSCLIIDKNNKDKLLNIYGNNCNDNYIDVIDECYNKLILIAKEVYERKFNLHAIPHKYGLEKYNNVSKIIYW